MRPLPWLGGDGIAAVIEMCEAPGLEPEDLGVGGDADKTVGEARLGRVVLEPASPFGCFFFWKHDEAYASKTGSVKRGFPITEAICKDPWMPSAFGTLLKTLLDERNLTFRSFGAAVGKSSGNLSNIIKGEEYTPPLDQMNLWADTLELKGEKRAEFLELAYLEHCPEPIRKEYLRQKAVITKMEERISRLEKRS